MSSVGLKIKLGAEVPVVLQLSDGDTGLFPAASIYDNEGNLLQTVNLSHDANGNYAPGTAYTMPNENFIKVIYITYTDSGRTTESTQHGRVVDVFSLDTITKDLVAASC